MNKHSKYRPLMDDIKNKICNAEIGVTGLYRLMFETLDEAEQELNTIKASISKIKADAVREAIQYFETKIDKNHIDIHELEEYANKLEAVE